MPSISVILTSINQAKYICEAIDSTLNQTFTDFELIILDDCSSDNSWELIKQYTDSRIKAIRSEGRGEVAYLLNKTITELASGKYIAIHHSDHVWELDKLEKQVAFLNSHSEIGAVFTNTLAINEGSLLLCNEKNFYSNIFDQSNRTRHEWLRFFFCGGNPLSHPSVLIRKACYEDCGLYRYEMVRLPDFEMWVRLCMKYEIHVLPESLVKFQMLGKETNASGQYPETRIQTLYEFYKLLQNFRKFTNFEDLVNIFPLAAKYYRNEETDLDFVLAMVALEEQTFTFTQLFGQELLFEIISDPKRSAAIKRLYNFDYKSFIALTAKYDVFSREEVSTLQRNVAERDGQIFRLNKALIERGEEIVDLNKALAKQKKVLTGMIQSKSWRITKPFRLILSTFVRHPQNQSSGHKLSPSFTSGSIQSSSMPVVLAQYAPENSEYVPLFKGKPLKNKLVKLICFYLPQLHPIPENDIGWGNGDVQPVDHYQPHVFSVLAYYDLLDPGIQSRQIELAKLYGIEGFCFYFYWFEGKQLLETPIKKYLEDDNLDLPFCLCWANENWSRRWDGMDKDILIAQQHSQEDDIAFIQHVSLFMRDSRYIRIDNKPLLLLYRPSLLLSAKKTAGRWRQWCRDQGIGEIYLAYTQSFEAVDPVIYGFDAAIEFPPNEPTHQNVTDKVQPLRDDFICNVFDWNKFVDHSRNYKKPKYTLFRGVCPLWNSTTRRRYSKSSFLLNRSPLDYQEWLLNAIVETVERLSNPEQRLIFINAWNGWADGSYLEPDQRYGYANLEATRMALVRKTVVDSQQVPDSTHSIAVVIHAFYEDVFDEILNYLENINSISLKLYVTTPIELFETTHRKLQKQQHSFFVLAVSNRGRDILPFIKIMPEVLKDGYDLLIKVHTKKSIHRQDGEVWRNDIFEKLLSESALTANIDHLVNNPEIGILGPTDHIVPMSFYWGLNAVRVTKLAARMGIDNYTLEKLNFVAGSMFIARTKAVIPLMNIALTEADFEVEAGQVDGTLAHALERLFSVSAFTSRLKISCPDNIITESYKYNKH